jgi:hypothetical protein
LNLIIDIKILLVIAILSYDVFLGPRNNKLIWSAFFITLLINILSILSIRT